MASANDTEFDEATRVAAAALSEYLQSEFGKCADFDAHCEACKRWAAFNVIFPERAVKWGKAGAT